MFNHPVKSKNNFFDSSPFKYKAKYDYFIHSFGLWKNNDTVSLLYSISIIDRLFTDYQ